MTGSCLTLRRMEMQLISPPFNLQLKLTAFHWWCGCQPTWRESITGEEKLCTCQFCHLGYCNYFKMSYLTFAFAVWDLGNYPVSIVEVLNWRLSIYPHIAWKNARLVQFVPSTMKISQENVLLYLSFWRLKANNLSLPNRFHRNWFVVAANQL